MYAEFSALIIFLSKKQQKKLNRNSRLTKISLPPKMICQTFYILDGKGYRVAIHLCIQINHYLANTMSRAESQSPFDPFSIADEEEPGALISGASQSTHTSKTKNTTTTKESAKPLPPRINVKVALHEEISSTAVVDKDADGGVSMSQLSIEGSVTVRYYVCVYIILKVALIIHTRGS